MIGKDVAVENPAGGTKDGGPDASDGMARSGESDLRTANGGCPAVSGREAAPVRDGTGCERCVRSDGRSWRRDGRSLRKFQDYVRRGRHGSDKGALSRFTFLFALQMEHEAGRNNEGSGVGWKTLRQKVVQSAKVKNVKVPVEIGSHRLFCRPLKRLVDGVCDR